MTAKTRSQQTAADIVAQIRSRAPLVWIVTTEEARVESYLVEACAVAKYVPRTWDSAQGLRKMDGSEDTLAQGDPDISATFRVIREQAEGNRGRGVWILRDLPPWLALGPQATRQMRNLCRLLPNMARDGAQTMIVLTPSTQVPPELSGHAIVVEWPMPDREEIAAILDTAIKQQPEEIQARLEADLVNGKRELAIDAAVGLSGEEAESCYARSLVTTRTIDPVMITKDKKKVIAKSGVLEWYDPLPGGLDAVGGLEPMKAWLGVRAKAYSKAAREYGLPTPKGIFQAGVPGCGKTMNAKAVAATWSVPLLKLDMGALKSKFVGESEQNLRKAFRVIESVGRCVVLIDEIEKGLAGGTQGGSDGGVSADALGALLGWMQDRTSQAFVMATCNSVETLPPELLRKGRWDEMFFVDLPGLGERKAIIEATLKTHKRTAKVDTAALAELTQDYTGSELASLIPDAMYAAFADGGREITTQDLVDAVEAIGDNILAKTQAAKVNKLRDWAKSGVRRANASDVVVKAKSGRAVDYA